MDRLDCQFIMGLYTLAHYTTFIHPESVNPVSALMQRAVRLDSAMQVELFNRLGMMLQESGLVTHAG